MRGGGVNVRVLRRPNQATGKEKTTVRTQIRRVQDVIIVFLVQGVVQLAKQDLQRLRHREGASDGGM
jgi:hypothetical protein